MWLLDVRSPRSDAECPGGARQGTFNRTQRDVVSVFLLGVNMVSLSSWRYWLDLFRRQTSVQSACSSALMDPQPNKLTL